ncbi:DUF6882 domain-containing protein [Corynebacterium sp.]|uniref:DUF6882 domain-containing protein n=1 Tax=Corynebacterium sp. TaxID=1720 RepID=UPI0026E022EA|nr:DUF6882 domain-containing protein [Corynebacterium sp.]MDO5512706.1 hypothetical protein [Corynebacterium sp.]
MHLPAPTSLADLRADGALIQADIDATWTSAIGRVEGIEYSGDIARVHTRAGARDLPATEVARIADGQWTWSRGYELDIPELSSPRPASDVLLCAARTLHGNVPVFLAPFPDGQRAMAIDFRPSPGPLRSALTLGLAQLPPELDTRRALLSLAAARGLGVRETPTTFEFADGTAVTFREGQPAAVSGGMRETDVLADALYYSAEHQLLLDGRFPDAEISLDIASGRAIVHHEFSADAVIVATITGDTWTWGWADPHLPPSPAANLRRFGIDHGLLDLVRPRIPARPELIEVCKPILDIWTHATVALNSQTRAVVLLSAPELTLPGPEAPTTGQAVAVTLQAAVPEGVDKQRARAAYAQRRGVTLPAPPE